MAGELSWVSWRQESDSGMGRFSGETRTDDQGGPGGIFIEERAEGFEQKREVLLIGVPAADGDDLVLFGDGRLELKDIGLNGVRNAVNLFWVGPQPDREFLPKCGGMRGFDKDGGQKPNGFS